MKDKRTAAITRKPNVYLVGAPKSATSSLAYMLSQHPQTNDFLNKEPNYHCQDLGQPGAKTEAEYLSCFTNITSETKVIFDASILCLYSKTAARSIASYTPDAKIVMMLRNPSDAVYSWHAQMVFAAIETIQNFKEALDAETYRKNKKHMISPNVLFYSEIMNYPEQIRRYLDHFPRDRILILIYDDFRTNPIPVYDEVLDFLELAPFKPFLLAANKSKARRSLLLQKILKTCFAAPARTFLPPQLRLKAIKVVDYFNAVQRKRPPLDEEVMAELKEKYKPQIHQLEDLLNRDLHHWY